MWIFLLRSGHDPQKSAILPNPTFPQIEWSVFKTQMSLKQSSVNNWRKTKNKYFRIPETKRLSFRPVVRLGNVFFLGLLSLWLSGNFTKPSCNSLHMFLFHSNSSQHVIVYPKARSEEPFKWHVLDVDRGIMCWGEPFHVYKWNQWRSK